MENYEALGRYVAAKEQAEKFARDRSFALNDLANLISESKGSGSGVIAHSFNIVKAQELLASVAESNENLFVAVRSANTYADACGRPHLRILGDS